MIAILLSALLLDSVPQPYSAQCLTEVASLSGDDLDIRNEGMRRAAAKKADTMMLRHRDLIAALQEYDRAHAAYAATLPDEIAQGKMPPGSEEAVRRRMLRDRNEFTSPAMTVEVTAPSCEWPALPEAPAR